MEKQLNADENIKALVQLVSKEQELPRQIQDYFTSLFCNSQNTKQRLEKDWKEIFNLVMAVLEKHPSVYVQFSEKQQQSFLNKLISSSYQHLDNQQLYDHLISKLTANIGIACQFLILNILISLSIKPTLKITWQRLLPLILKTAGAILHHYLKIKNQKASGSTDKIAADIVIQSNTQNWIELLFLNALESYSKLLSSNKELRRYFINFGCDFQQALLQSFLGSELNKEVLTTLMFEVSKLFIKQYSAIQLVNIFNKILRQNNMITPVKNVEIVDIYESSSLINPNGFNYIVKSMISEPHSQFTLSQYTILKCLIPILSESIKRQFPFKHDILELAEKTILSINFKAISDDDFEYPLSLLVTNLIASKQNQSQFTNKKIDNMILKIKDWNWSLGKCLDFSSSVYVKKFVLEEMNKTNSFEYSILNSFNPIDSEKEFTEAYINTLNKVQLAGKEKYQWVNLLLEDKRKFNIVEQRLKL